MSRTIPEAFNPGSMFDDTVKPRRCDVCRALVGYLVRNDERAGIYEWKPLDSYAGFTASGRGYRCLKHPVEMTA